MSDNDLERPESDTIQLQRHGGTIMPDGGVAVGTELGEYVIDGVIGIGGCGAVYTAHHKDDEANVAAVKVMHKHMTSSPKLVSRFLREARAVDVIDHPNIVDIYDMGELPDGRPYQVMELVPGLTLASALETRGRFDPELTLEVLRPLCSALQEAHDAGVLHRDLKLSNVMVDFEADPMRVTLLDFGVAKLMDADDGPSEDTTGVMMGTPQVMAPEQINGDPVDQRTDQYSLGVMVFTMLTGRPPFDTRDINALLQQHLSATPPRVSEFAPVGSAIDTVVTRALEKSVDARFDSVDDFLDAFAEATSQAPSPRRATTVIPEPLIAEEVDNLEPKAVGIYIAAALVDENDQFDDELLDDISLCLEEAEVSLRDAGFQILIATGTALLGVKVLPTHEPSTEQATRHKAITLAKRLQTSLNAEAIERAVLDVHAHVDKVSVRGDAVAGDVTGGPLSKPEDWMSPDKSRTAYISPTLSAGLPD